MITINSKCLKKVYLILFMAVLAGGLVANYVVFPSFTNMLVRRTQDNAERVTTYIGKYVFPDHYGAVGLDQEIISKLEEHIEELNLYKLKVFSRRGEILYSTDHQEVGKISSDDYFHNIVARGSIYSKNVQKKSKSLEGKKVDKDVVEVYVPIMRHGFFVGALELYYDVTSDKKVISNNIFFCNVLFFGFAFVFLSLLQLVLHKLDKVLLDRKAAYKSLKRINVELQGEIDERKRVEKELEQANEELEKIAMVDGLTAIANRRQFDFILQKEWQRKVREKHEMALILCDIDYFKKYNDTYGHISGDDCLRKVAQCIESTLKRPGDLAARYGGEEFAVILPHTSIEGALKLAEDIRKAVMALKIPHSQSNISRYVSLSIGVSSTVPSWYLSPTSLVEGADYALYMSKQNGRNQVTRDVNTSPSKKNKSVKSREFRLIGAFSKSAA